MKIALISDIHEDYISLMQAVRHIERKKCDMVICLGDIVGYSVPFYNYLSTRDARACVQWVKQNCAHAVAGNHDLYACRKVPVSKARDFVYPADWYKMSYHKRKELGGEQVWLYEDNELPHLLDDDSLDYLNGLTENLSLHVEGKSCLFSHFVHPDISGSAKPFIYDKNDLRVHLQFLKEHKYNLSITGHMHFEGIVKLIDGLMVRTGFSRKKQIYPFDWVSIPPITQNGRRNGFVIWDTKEQTLETILLRSKFNIL